MKHVLVSVVGARPQFIKLSPVCRAIATKMPGCCHKIIHTGQHYDPRMSEVFFEGLRIPPPDINLGIGSGSHATQTAAMTRSLGEQLQTLSPHVVLTFGDTNSTLSATLAASKLHIPVFHVEAGLRSFDRKMPEEINRIVADHCADQLFAPTEEAMKNLNREGLADRSVLVGDVMYDAILHNLGEGDNQLPHVATERNLGRDQYGLVTIHRASSTTSEVIMQLMQTLAEVSENMIPLIFPMHPRTRAALQEASAFLCQPPGLHIVEPQSYQEMLSLVRNARLVLTDSGGLQKEAACLSTPCVTLRKSTEWVETIAIGANTLAGLSRQRILQCVENIMATEDRDWSESIQNLYGDGKASERIADVTFAWLSSHPKQAKG